MGSSRDQVRGQLIQPISIILFALAVQLASLYPIWSHRSTGDLILGGYSSRYLIVLAAYVILAAGWLVAFLFRDRLGARLAGAMTVPRAALAITGVLGLITFFWLLPVEDFVQQYLALNGIAFVALCILNLPQNTTTTRLSALVLGILCAGFVVLALLTTLSTFPFSPDEAHWLDYALSAARHGGVYSRAWLMEPITIKPGIGWSVALYGLAQDASGVQIQTGRIWNFAFYAAAIVVSGLLAARLYGRRAASISVMFAALSFAFFPVFDYRPDHQMPLATAVIALFAYNARRARSTPAITIWHLLTGLCATLSMQLHAVGIALAFGVALLISADAIAALRKRRLAEYLPGMLAFALGAGAGTAIYFFANVVSAGGLSPFLNDLFAERADRLRWFAYLTWPSLLEALVILAAFVYIGLRRNPADRFVLSLTACILIGLTIFDTQGYITPVTSLYVLPVGTLIVSGFASAPNQPGRSSLRSLLAGTALMIALAGQFTTFINWQRLGDWIIDGEMPEYAFAAVRPTLLERVSDDDIIVSSHFLLWALPDHESLYSAAGEITAMRRWQISGEAVWERVNPTVIITIDDMMEIPAGLAVYMQSYEKCDTVQTQSLTFNFYRPECPA